MNDKEYSYSWSPSSHSPNRLNHSAIVTIGLKNSCHIISTSYENSENSENSESGSTHELSSHANDRSHSAPIPISDFAVPRGNDIKLKLTGKKKQSSVFTKLKTSRKKDAKRAKKGKKGKETTTMKRVETIDDEIDYDGIEIDYDEIEEDDDDLLTFDDDHMLDWDVDVCFTPDDGWNYRFEEVENGQRLAGGTLNAMVKYLTSAKVDMEFTNAFIYTYKSFTTPKMLLEKILEQYEGQNLTGPESSAGKIVRTRCLGFLINWINEDAENFSRSMYLRLKGIADDIIKQGGSTMFADKLFRYMKKAYIGRGESEYRITEDPPPSILPRDFEEGTWEFMDLDPVEIARQLCLVDFTYYKKIVKSEFMNQAWSKYKEKAPNIINNARRFNSISAWTADSIVSSPTLKERWRMYTMFLNIAWELYHLKNFSSAVAITAGLNNAAVHRLKFTREKVSLHTPEHIEMLETLTSVSDASGAYKRYREEISNSLPPCIPHVGVYLTDLTFIDDGSDNIVDGLVNFNKRRLIFQTIRGFRDFQTTPYNFQVVEPIRDYLSEKLSKSEGLEDKTLFTKSLEAEPRGAESVL